MSGIDILLYSILGFLILVLIGVIIFIAVMLGQYKHTFIRKVVTGGETIKLVDKAKEWKEKETGVIYWRLLKAKHIISRPPPKALTITDKGNYFVEAYYLGDIDYKYIENKDNKALLGNLEELREKTVKKTLQDVNDIAKIKIVELNSKTIINNLLMKYFIKDPKPLYIYSQDNTIISEKNNTITTDERLLAHDQIKKAYERKHKGIAQFLPMIAGISALVVLIAVIFIFGADLIRPLVEFGDRFVILTDNMNGIAQKLDDTARLLSGTIKQEQYINAQGGGTIPYLNGTIPN